jgi:hypothetical protein
MHHLEPDSPSRLAGKPIGGAGRACVDDRRGTVGRVYPLREAGRAVRCRRPRAALPQPGWIVRFERIRRDHSHGRGAAPGKHRGQDPSRPPTISLAPSSPSSDVAGLPSGLSAGSAVVVGNASCPRRLHDRGRNGEVVQPGAGTRIHCRRRRPRRLRQLPNVTGNRPDASRRGPALPCPTG